MYKIYLDSNLYVIYLKYIQDKNRWFVKLLIHNNGNYHIHLYFFSFDYFIAPFDLLSNYLYKKYNINYKYKKGIG